MYNDISGHTLNDYYKSLNELPKNLTTIITNANDLIKGINDSYNEAHTQYAEGFYTEKMLNSFKTDCIAKAKDIKADALEAIDKALNDVEAAKEWCITVNPKALDGQDIQLLQLVTLTENEYNALLSRYKNENYTLYRVVLSQAVKNGYNALDEVSLEVETLDKAVNTFAEYCRGNILEFNKTTTPYSENWGNVITAVATPLLEAGN